MCDGFNQTYMTSVSGQWGPSGTSLMLLRLSGGMILDSTCRHRQRVLYSLLIGGIPVINRHPMVRFKIPFPAIRLECNLAFGSLTLLRVIYPSNGSIVISELFKLGAIPNVIRHTSTFPALTSQHISSLLGSLWLLFSWQSFS